MTTQNPWQDNTPANNPWLAAYDGAAEAPRPVSPLSRIDFVSAMAQNRRNTWYLIIGMLGLAAGFGYILGWAWDTTFGGAIGAGLHYTASGSVNWSGLILTPSPMGRMLAITFFVGMLVWSCIALMRADKVVLGMADAQPLADGDLPQLHNIVEELAIAAGLPKPKIVVLPTEMPNAFATGLRPENATVGVTQGLLQRLNRRELQAVMAHEMAHIRNDDMRYATILAVMAGVLVFIAQMVMNMRHFMAYGAPRGKDGNGNGRGGGHPILFIVMIVVFILTAILVPLLAQLIQMAISRQREYLADATAVQLTRDPGGLINALQKIAESSTPRMPMNRALEPLFIVTPAQMLQNSHKAWFSTHPPIEKRIERLKALE